jgi:hypothetical protein
MTVAAGYAERLRVAAIRWARLAVFPARLATARQRVLPDFLVIGAQRAGTTSLYRYLLQHPDVAPARVKEVHFFDDAFARGPAWYRAHFPRAAALSRPGAARRRITGEATPYYLFHPAVPGRVAALLPDVKLIAILRDPVDRAYSHYWLQRAFGRERLSFEDAVASEDDRLRGDRDDRGAHRWFSYLARGIYVDQLVRWGDYVPRGSLLVLESERLLAEPQASLREVTAFLGLSDPPPLARERRHHGKVVAPMREETRARLNDLFEPHNERLFRFLGRDFAWGWHRAPRGAAAGGGAR